jgi:hypothetical protein
VSADISADCCVSHVIRCNPKRCEPVVERLPDLLPDLLPDMASAVKDSAFGLQGGDEYVTDGVEGTAPIARS